MEAACLLSCLGLSDKKLKLSWLAWSQHRIARPSSLNQNESGVSGDFRLAFLMAHELDAVHCQEWKMLPMLNFLDDNVGYQVFTILHVPIFAAILFGTLDSCVSNNIWLALNKLTKGLLS